MKSLTKGWEKWYEEVTEDNGRVWSSYLPGGSDLGAGVKWIGKGKKV